MKIQVLVVFEEETLAEAFQFYQLPGSKRKF